MASASSSLEKSDGRSGIVDKAWTVQQTIESRVSQLGKGRYGRVVRMARKPTPEQFRKSATVAAVGIVILGFIGFVVYLLMSLIPQTG